MADYQIGLNKRMGGFIFYVTPNGKHGLVASLVDQSNSCDFLSSQNIINQPSFHDIIGQKFVDWRLPSLYELKLMYDLKNKIENFGSYFYWCSTFKGVKEHSPPHRMIELVIKVDFDWGNEIPTGKFDMCSVRAVRAF